MRSFFERHSALYRWAARPSVESAAAWKDLAFDIDEDLRQAQADFQEERQAFEIARANADVLHQADIDRHDKANSRLRRVNKHLVSKLREQGVPATEFPAERCPNCGSFAAVPEDGKHQMGSVAHDGVRFRLFCDGSEE